MEPSLGTPYFGEAGFKFTQTCLPVPPECWDHRVNRRVFVLLCSVLGKVLLHSPDWPETWDNHLTNFLKC